MNEIEKMYENAGIDYEERYNNCTLNKEGECKLKCSCDICKYSEEKYIYPPFTAEKQLNIIKWLLKNYDIGFSQLGERIDTSLDGINCISGLGSGNTFEESLAQAINDLWQFITEEEKQRIKDILQ